MDDEVVAKLGITLVRDARTTQNSGGFRQMNEAYERQKGICVKCKKKFQLDEMEGDHIKPWHEGGKTNAANCQMLCKEDNRRKSGR